MPIAFSSEVDTGSREENTSNITAVQPQANSPMMPDGGYSRPSAKAGGRFVFDLSLLALIRSRSILRSDTTGHRAMTQSAIAAADELWRQIRREAEDVVASDPVFGASLAAAILGHADLAGAVSYQIGERLGKSPADRRASHA